MQEILIGDIRFILELPTSSYDKQVEEAGAMETIHGEVIEELPPPSSQNSASRILIVALIGVGLICACTGLAAAAYAFILL